MTREFKQTPDGRIIVHGTREPDETPPVHRIRTLRVFFRACLTTLPDKPLDAKARTGFFLFLLGATDRYWHRLGLNDEQFPVFTEALMAENGISEAEATTLSAALPQVREQEFGRDALLEGAEALDLWLDSHDKNAVMRVGELIQQWSRG